MSEYGLYALAYAVFLLLFFYMKSYDLRKWLGITLLALGFASILRCHPSSRALMWVSLQPVLLLSVRHCFLAGHGMWRESVFLFD